MATATVPATALNLDARGVELAREVLYETESLLDLIGIAVAPVAIAEEASERAQIERQVRGLTRRLNDLNSVLLGLVDGDGDTGHHERRVHGQAAGRLLEASRAGEACDA